MAASRDPHIFRLYGSLSKRQNFRPPAPHARHGHTELPGLQVRPANAALRGRLDKDGRIGTTQMRAARWSTFKLATNGDLRDALDWLGQAYQEAGKKKRTR
jgi:hypothetical protein